MGVGPETESWSKPKSEAQTLAQPALMSVCT